MKYSSVTDKGDRDVNEDCLGYSVRKQRAMFVVCDGLGGHGHGDEASSAAVKLFVDTFIAYPGDSIEADEVPVFFHDCFEGAQSALVSLQNEAHLPNSLKTTAAVLVVYGEYAVWAYIGDTRIYHFRGKKLLSRTLDHSVPQMLVASGEIKESQIRGHPDRNRLLRALGDDCETVRYTASEPVKVKKNDYFLLCSDGFWEWIVEKDMIRIIFSHDNPDDALKEMAEAVSAAGAGKGMDNFTAQLICI